MIPQTGNNSMAATQNEVWVFLEPRLNDIMLNLDKGLTVARWMEIYTGIYNYCTSSANQTVASTLNTNSSRGLF